MANNEFDKFLSEREASRVRPGALKKSLSMKQQPNGKLEGMRRKH